MNAWEAIIPISMAIMLGFIAWVIGRTMQEKSATRSREQIHTKMIDKFSASDEFIRFMQTPEGTKYLESFTERPKARPAEKIIGAARTGVILIMLSLGFMLTGALLDRGSMLDSPTFFIGLLGFFLGVGFLASGIVSHKLSRSFGLLDDSQHGTDSRE